MDVAIIDYKISNMFSVLSGCRHFGLQAEMTNDRDKILSASAAILPGVGTFGEAMSHLTDMKLIPVIHEFIATGKPFMGICLGMQLLMSESQEFGTHAGLNIIPGTVKRFPNTTPQGQSVKVPHMGWNAIKIATHSNCQWPSAPMNGLGTKAHMYFVHSYYVKPDDSSYILTTTDYGGIEFCSSLAHKNIFACQFHPEKSGKEGLKIIKNLSESIKNLVV